MADEMTRMHFRRMDEASPYYDRTVEFTAKYDEVSFDAVDPNEPIGTLEPILSRVLDKPWSPPKSPVESSASCPR
jgi:hypothetical protein